MEGQQVKGTTAWKEYSIVLPANREGRTLYFGFLLVGTGRAWADDLQLLVDGRPVWLAPKAVPIQTILDRDHEFDDGSRIILPELSSVQITNLATHGEVWGFLKYHHLKVTSGQRHWDYELFRIMPAVLAARDGPAANEILLGWIEGLGEARSDARADAEPADFHLRPDFAWLDNEAVLGKQLSQRLRAIGSIQLANSSQFYVSLAPDVGNPVFTHESDYSRIKLPDAGYQLLGLFRFWNIIRFWFPYRDLIDENWTAVLTEFIPRIGLAQNADAYQVELFALIAKAHDSHATLWSSLHLRPPVGDAQLPVTVRFIGGKPVVTDLPQVPRPSSTGFQRADVICAIGGIPVEQLINNWSRYYGASNEAARQRDIAGSLGRGPAGPVNVLVQRGGETFEVEATRIPINTLTTPHRWHDLPGPAFRLLSKDVAYLTLSSVKGADIPSYVEQAAGTKGWIIDLRNYPAEFMVVTLGSHLIPKPTEVVRFTFADLKNPGAFTFSEPLLLDSRPPHYPGKVVILVDEMTQSSAEYTAMALRAAPGAIVVGSTTAGADGNVSAIPLPGGLRTMISGIGVFYADRRPTQRIGIIPDIAIMPSLAGIRAGRDEVLEEALRQILGPQIPAEEIVKQSLAESRP
jgi:C-terminal processing protease CtpA/Prc